MMAGSHAGKILLSNHLRHAESHNKVSELPLSPHPLTNLALSTAEGGEEDVAAKRGREEEGKVL